MALVIVAIVTALAVAACGSSESSPASQSSKSNGSAKAVGATEPANSGRESGRAIKPIEGKGYLETSPSRTTGLGIRPGEGPDGQERKEKAEAAGKQAAEESGPPVKLPKIKVGFINYLSGIESSDRNADTTIYAATQLGWETIVCDGKGEPSRWLECGNSLLGQGVSAIIETGIEPSQIKSVLAKAKQMKVPVVQVAGGEVPPIDGMEGSYGPNEHHAGLVLAEALMERLDALPGTVQIAVHNFPAIWGKDRTMELQRLLRKQSKVKAVSEVVSNGANLVNYARESTTHEMTQYPNLKAIWYTYDVTAQVGGQVVGQQYKGKEFPEKPIVASFHAELATLAFMRKGDITLDSDVNYEAACWEGVNEIAEYLARKREISKDTTPSYPVIGDPFSYEIVTPNNLPPEGQYVQPKWDVASYFISKWQHEFTE